MADTCAVTKYRTERKRNMTCNCTPLELRYDTIEEINVDSKAEYTA